MEFVTSLKKKVQINAVLVFFFVNYLHPDYLPFSSFFQSGEFGC